MTSPRPFSCPNCGATPADGTEFVAEIPLTGSQTCLVTGDHHYGDIVLDPLDFDVEPTTFRAFDVTCRGCGHEWRSRRSYMTQSSE